MRFRSRAIPGRWMSKFNCFFRLNNLNLEACFFTLDEVGLGVPPTLRIRVSLDVIQKAPYKPSLQNLHVSPVSEMSSGSTVSSLYNPSCVTHPALRRYYTFCDPIAYKGKDLRNAHDAHIVLEAVRRNVLPLIKRRLLAYEREQLRSGHVYVWQEAQDDGGLLRWTDGRRWSSSINCSFSVVLTIKQRSQSRMRGDHLFYEEKIEITQEERDAKAARRQVNLFKRRLGNGIDNLRFVELIGHQTQM